MKLLDKPVLRFMYTNYRGVTEPRRVRPLEIRYGSTTWHPEPQWLMLAHDLDKDAEREFAMKDMREVGYRTRRPLVGGT